MNLQFTKMHGLGNDFMVIDGINQNIHLTEHDIVSLANRNRGIGFDQCLLVEKSQEPGVDFFYRIFNADGKEVGQCGNGARCLLRFVYNYGLTKKHSITVKTRTTTMELHLNSDHTVTVDMGKPKLKPQEIPANFPNQAPFYELTYGVGEIAQIHAINVGNPHAVMIVPDVASMNLNTLGKQISEHPLFIEQANAGFMQILNPSHICLRVYERGCGETSACGSGAVAAAAIGRLYHQLSEKIKVSLPGGDLMVSWPNLNGSIFLTGPATFVYEGRLI